MAKWKTIGARSLFGCRQVFDRHHFALGQALPGLLVFHVDFAELFALSVMARPSADDAEERDEKADGGDAQTDSERIERVEQIYA